MNSRHRKIFGYVTTEYLCIRSAHIEFWMHLNSLFNKCRRTVILIPTKLCQDEQNKIKYSRAASKQDRFFQHKNLTDQCLKVFYK